MLRRSVVLQGETGQARSLPSAPAGNPSVILASPRKTQEREVGTKRNNPASHDLRHSVTYTQRQKLGHGGNSSHESKSQIQPRPPSRKDQREAATHKGHESPSPPWACGCESGGRQVSAVPWASLSLLGTHPPHEGESHRRHRFAPSPDASGSGRPVGSWRAWTVQHVPGSPGVQGHFDSIFSFSLTQNGTRL